ncbi:MAG: PLP-dependent aspartate aminotransferase family protein [Candidatus Bathyarchaeia archaeon]
MVKRGGFSTLSVHAGEFLDPYSGSVTVPIYQTSTFAFESTDTLLEVASGRRRGYIYTRYGNPTVRAAEEKVAALEGAEDCLAFSSGMAAVSSAVLAFLEEGDRMVSLREVYGGTYELFTEFLPRFGVEVALTKGSDTSSIKEELEKGCNLLFLETPTNPLLGIVDLAEVVDLARSEGAKTIVDNTFATPYNQRPMDFGVDLVVHSATKYLGGHSDLIGGVVAGSREDISKIWGVRKVLGGVLDPHAAWLLLRGLKTLALRVSRHNSNAQAVAEFLEGHPKVERVYYPGLPSHPGHEIALKQMSGGFGGVVSFEVKGGFREAAKLVDNFKLGFIAPSLGGVETLITQPVTTSHYYMPREEREKAGIRDNLVRIALGIEDEEDLITALEEALKKV